MGCVRGGGDQPERHGCDLLDNSEAILVCFTIKRILFISLISNSVNSSKVYITLNIAKLLELAENKQSI